MNNLCLLGHMKARATDTRCSAFSTHDTSNQRLAPAPDASSATLVTTLSPSGMAKGVSVGPFSMHPGLLTGRSLGVGTIQEPSSPDGVDDTDGLAEISEA